MKSTSRAVKRRTRADITYSVTRPGGSSATDPDKIDSVRVSGITRRKVSPVSMMPTLKRSDIFDLMMFVLAVGKVTHPAFDQ